MAFKMKGFSGFKSTSPLKDYVKKVHNSFTRVNEDHKSSKPRSVENKFGVLFPTEYHSHGLTRGEMRGDDKERGKPAIGGKTARTTTSKSSNVRRVESKPPK